MTEGTIPIWVILVSYNQIKDLKRVLGALSQQENPAAGIVLVDNGSLDGTLEWVKNKHPEIKLIDSGENLGFAGANNLGAARAIELGAAWLLLLNTDTEPASGFLGAFWESVENHPGFGAYQPLIIYGDGETVWSAGGHLRSVSMLPELLRQGEKASGGSGELREIDYVVGCAFLTTAAVWRATGGLWADLFMYYEDSELSLRIRSLGYELACVPDATLIHHTPQDDAEKFTRPYAIYYLTRNRLYMVFYYGKRKILGLIIAAFADALKALAFVVKRRDVGAALAVVNGWTDFIAGEWGIWPG
jgi:hypothetical protein